LQVGGETGRRKKKITTEAQRHGEGRERKEIAREDARGRK
jgi:hypothetical protein